MVLVLLLLLLLLLGLPCSLVEILGVQEVSIKLLGLGLLLVCLWSQRRSRRRAKRVVLFFFKVYDATERRRSRSVRAKRGGTICSTV